MGTKIRPANITDPTYDGHVVVLHPRQPLNVRLTNVEGSWQHQIESEYLLTSGVNYLDDRTEFVIGQYYDLEQWAEYSVVHLGEVLFWEVGNEAKNTRILSVQLQRRGTAPGVMTVINPVGQKVRLSRPQVLELVCFDRSEKDQKTGYWASLYDLGDRSNWLEPLRREVVPADGFQRRDPSFFRSLPRSLACLPRNPLLPSPVPVPKVARRDGRQHHFWFRVRPGSDLPGKPLGVRVSLENGVSSPSTIRVILDHRGQSQEGEYADAVRGEGNQRSLTQRYLSMSDGFISCPNEKESIEFRETPSRAQEMVVEMAAPEVFNVDAKGRWDHGVETSALYAATATTPRKDRLTAEELEPRTVNGVQVQRFRVQAGVRELPPDTQAVYLGTLHLTVGSHNREIVLQRQITFWLNKDPQHREERPQVRMARRAPVVSVVSAKEVVRVAIEEKDDLRDGFEPVRFSEIKVGGGKKKRRPADEVASHHSAAGRVSVPRLSSEAAPLVIEDPRDRQVVLLTPRQRAVFRLPLDCDNGLLREAIWGCTPIHTDKPLFYFHDQGFHPRPKGRSWQQITVALLPPKTPFGAGQHLIGGLWFRNRDSHFAVALGVHGPSDHEVDQEAVTDYAIARSVVWDIFKDAQQPALLPVKAETVVDEPDGHFVLLNPGSRLRVRLSPHLISLERGPTLMLNWSLMKWPNFLIPASSKSVDGRQEFEFVADAVASGDDDSGQIQVGIPNQAVRRQLTVMIKSLAGAVT